MEVNYFLRLLETPNFPLSLPKVSIILLQVNIQNPALALHCIPPEENSLLIIHLPKVGTYL